MLSTEVHFLPQEYFFDTYICLLSISKKIDNCGLKQYVQYNLDLVTLNLVTTCDLVTILLRLFFNLQHKITRFIDIMPFSDSFCRDQNCHEIEIALYSKS